MFIPKRAYIHPKSKHSKRAKEILARIHTHAPKAELINLPESGFDYPEGMAPRDKFYLMKESVIISERTVPFIRTFSSPGNIVERLTIVCNLTNACCANCEYCYLQFVKCSEHYIYTDRNVLEKELASSSYSHWAILTVWTMYSFGIKSPLMKLPDNFVEVADGIREYFVKHRIVSDRASIDYIYGKQAKIYEDLKAVNVPKDAFNLSREIIKQYYDKNKEYPLVLTSSEYADIFAIDHLTGNISFMMKMLEKYPKLRMTARTKSAYVDEMIKYDGFGRIRINMGLNTEHIIKAYEQGTSSLQERIDAARRIQQAKGIALSLVIEPIITYEGFEEDYVKMIEYAMKQLDPTKIHTIIVGSARYTPQLRSAIQMHFPKTSLFDASQNLQDPVPEDKRLRYPVDFRVHIYSKIRDTFKIYTAAPFTLGSENPEVWEKLGMDPVGKIGDAVYQYTGNPHPAAPTTIETAENKESEKKMASGESFSLAFRIARQSFSDNDEGIDEQKFEITEKSIEAMIEDEYETSDGKKIKVHEYNHWKEEAGTRIQEILKTRKVWAPVKIVGTLQQVGHYYPIRLDAQGNDDPKEWTAVKLKLKDLDGEPVPCIPFPLEDSFVDIGTFVQTQQLLTLYGAIVSVSLKNKSAYRMYLRYISTEVDPEDVITKEPIKDYTDHPAIKFHDYRGTNRIIEYVKQQLVTGLGIKDLTKLPHLDLALEFMILQSLSQGKETYSHKLHSLVVGPPGVGKSYLTKAALILNPLSEEISASNKKITAAGLIGSVVSMGGKSSSENGLLPRNSMGCVCIQDFHEIRGRSREEIFGIFSKVMEDGEVVDSTSARRTHIAQTSIHLDQNRYSQIDKKGKYSQFSDINIPIHIISRFDFILDIPKDEQRQKELAKTIARGEHSALKGKQWKNELKTIIAFLRSNYRDMEYAPGIDKYRVERYDRLMDDIIDKYGSTIDLSDMHTRLSRSIDKYLRAITTAYATDEVTKEMVDYAFRFIEKKVGFLITLAARSESETTADDKSLELVKSIFQQLTPAIISLEARWYNTEDVFDRYVSGKGITVSKNRDAEKTKLSKLLKEKYKIGVKGKYIAKERETVRCYLLNNDQLKLFGLISAPQQSDGKKQVEPRKKAKIRPSFMRSKGSKKA